MRTIKFRGKSEDNSEWFYGFLQKYQEKRASRLCIFPVSVRTWKDARLYSVRPDTVGQFTGLHDKNGKEIYEGDIIRSDWGKGEVRHLISFFDIIASFVAEMLPDNDINDYCTLSQAWILKYNKEVIGNIHDNPELMKQND